MPVRITPSRAITQAPLPDISDMGPPRFPVRAQSPIRNTGLLGVKLLAVPVVWTETGVSLSRVELPGVPLFTAAGLLTALLGTLQGAVISQCLGDNKKPSVYSLSIEEGLLFKQSGSSNRARINSPPENKQSY